MADLISRAAALDAIDGMKPMQGSMEQLVMKSLCWAAVKTIQPVDAVPVVRCRDCKYGEPDTNGCGEDMVMCQNKLNPIGDGDWLMPPEFYCADGERRESE